MEKVILSHKRASRVTTHGYCEGAIICVPKAQEKDYKYYHPNVEIITHPDEIIGISPKRQWVYEKFGDVFMLDDDITGVVRFYTKVTKHVPSKVFSMWIDDLAYMAKQTGSKIFGFNSKMHPKTYEGKNPILFNRFITSGAFGILKSDDLFFPDYPHFVGEDYFINGLHAYYHRKALVDSRLNIIFANTEANTGGVADFRTTEKRKKTYEYLRKMFGEAIKRKKISDIKPKVMQWEKTLTIPF